MKPPNNPYVVQQRILREIASRRGKAEKLFGIEYLFLMAVCGGLMLMPAMLVRAVSGWFGYLARKLVIEAYAVAKPSILLFILYSHRYFSTFWVVISAILLADLYLYLYGLVFLRRFYTSPASSGRSLLLLGVNFVEALLAFAIFYGYSQSIAPSSPTPVPSVTDSFTLFYFSSVTAATVGYGDVIPITSTGRELVVFQILSSLGFVSIFVATFVTNLASRDKT